jgi:hypothetical protein
MSRSGYDGDDCENVGMWGMWRGQVASAIRGKRGQAFLRELVEALDALPSKRLIQNALQDAGDVCAIGSVGVKRGVNMEPLDVHDAETLSGVFGIAHQLVREIEFINDDERRYETPEERWARVRVWAQSNLRSPHD